MKKSMKRSLLLTLALGSLFSPLAHGQILSQFTWDGTTDERIAVLGPNATSSGSLSTALAPGNGTPQGCGPGLIPYLSSGCFTAGGCGQNIDLSVPNNSNMFNIPNILARMDYRHPVLEAEAWFFYKDNFAFGLFQEKLVARYSYDLGLGSCSAQTEFAFYPPAWDWPTNGGWIWGGPSPFGYSGQHPRDNTWRTYTCIYDNTSGVISISTNSPNHTEYSYFPAGRDFCGWTANPLMIGFRCDNGRSATSCLDNSQYGRNTTLPVILRYFDGKQHELGVDLEWATAKEIQNDHFLLYRSTDAQSWVPIGRVEGNHTTDEENGYTFRDESPYRGVNYYRLVQVDQNGASSGFPAIEVRMDYYGTGFLGLYPNPSAQNTVQVKFDAVSESEDLKVQILDMSGRIVSEQAFLLKSGINELDLDITALPAGVYTARFANRGRVSAEKFVKIGN